MKSWHNSANATRCQTQFARLLSQAHMLKINRDHRARPVSSNRENFRILTVRRYDTFFYAGDIRVPPRVPASRPEPCRGNKWQLFEISARLWHYNLGQWSYWHPHTMINVLPFFPPNVGLENGSTQLKNLFLNNIGRKEEKNRRQVTQLKCHRLINYLRSSIL